MELLLVPVVRNHYMSPFDGCPTAVKCLQCPLLLITITDMCPTRPICLLWSSCWFLWSVISIYRPFHWCQTAANVSKVPSCLLSLQTCAPWGSFVSYGAPFGSCGQKSLYVALWWVSDCCKISPGSPLAYYYGRPVLHGAHLSPMELLLVPVVSNIYISTLSLVSNCCKMSPRSPLAYYHCRLVPHGAQSSLMDLLMVPMVRNHYMSTLWWVSKCCKMSVMSLFAYCHCRLVPHGAHLFLWSSCWSLWSEKIIICRPLMGVRPCKMSPVSPSAYYHCRLVPHGAHLSLMDYGSRGQKSLYVALWWVSDCCKISPGSPFAYYHYRHVPH